MYGDDAIDEESRITTMAVVAVRMTVWLLFDSDDMDMEDNDDKEAEAAVEGHRDA
jgi:hypothetical protein